jgi:hypothetical protein
MECTVLFSCFEWAAFSQSTKAAIKGRRTTQDILE